jgi:Ca2+-binding RTX toxin-like protein
MAVLGGAVRAVPAAVITQPRITDLVWRDADGSSVLYATSRYGGGAITVWDMGPAASPALIDSAAYLRPEAAGSIPSLALVHTATGPALIAGGGVTGSLWRHATDAEGRITTGTWLGSLQGTLPGDLTETLSLTLADGRQAVYGGVAGAAGIARVVLTDQGALAEVRLTADSATTQADRLAGLASATIDGQRWLFSLGGRDPGITAWAVGPTGALTAGDSLTPEQGLWIAAPTALVAMQAAGQTYLVVAAAGSDSLSVVAVGRDGRLTPVDHVIDTLATRFAEVAALATVRRDGVDYLVAGGGDDGISLFQLLPGGRLLGLAHVADTTALGLAGVSALAARPTATGIEVVVASDSEAGLTRLAFGIAPGGRSQAITTSWGGTLTGGTGPDVLTGGAGSDSLAAGAGRDVLIDGAGSDTLAGGAGADVFVLSADGQADRITDFTPGEDRLDLSAWAFLRSPAQLVMTATPTGMTISYGDEHLTLIRAGGGSLQSGDFTWETLIGLDRLNPLQFVAGPPAPPGPTLRGTPQADRLLADPAGNRIEALDGHDTLIGGAGPDILRGGAGRDVLDGGAGRNRLEGGADNDRYIIRSLTDEIWGEAGFSLGGGIDTVDSWISFTLPQNLEILRLQGTADLAGAGNSAPEVLVGNSGANRLSGGWGDDRIVGKEGADTIIGGPGRDELVGDQGADTFVYLAATDSRAGIARRDFINGFERNRDHIDLSLIDTDPSRPGDQAFRFIGSAAFSGRPAELAVLNYGGNWCIVAADLDGDRQADFQIFVNQASTLGRGDFFL